MPNLLVGLELEIENFNPEMERYFPGVDFTDDGSLRSTDGGIGIEAITVPIETKYVRELLGRFFTQFEITPENYTERCSTHVHVNIDDMTPEQLATLCLLYQTVESLLFLYTGEERDKNIFCVPWNQCNLSYNIVRKIISYPEKSENPFRHWQKYSALNLIPIMNQGSVEFRHLGGTCDVDKIMTWIALLSCMFKYAHTTPLAVTRESILSMNTVSNYREWLNSIFGKYTDKLMVPGFEKSLANGVVDSKLMLMESKSTKAFYNTMTFTTNDLIADLTRHGVVEYEVRTDDIPTEWTTPPPARGNIMREAIQPIPAHPGAEAVAHLRERVLRRPRGA